MIKYIIDEQLPSNINVWKTGEFIHVRDIQPEFEDNEIWEYARISKLTIITKDGDFDLLFNNITTPFPRLIKLTIGNMVLKNFISFLKKDWPIIAQFSDTNRIVVANSEFIEVFS